MKESDSGIPYKYQDSFFFTSQKQLTIYTNRDLAIPISVQAYDAFIEWESDSYSSSMLKCLIRSARSSLDVVIAA